VLCNVFVLIVSAQTESTPRGRTTIKTDDYESKNRKQVIDVPDGDFDM